MKKAETRLENCRIYGRFWTYCPDILNKVHVMASFVLLDKYWASVCR